MLSPSLFNLYTEGIFRGIDSLSGVKVGGTMINNLRYADDTALLGENKEDLNTLVLSVKTESEKLGLKMNIKKTKTMVISRKDITPKAKILIDGSEVEQVEKFLYLGQLITEDGRSDAEIKRRIGMAKSAFLNIKHLLTNCNISWRTRFRLLKCYVWSILTYGCETWTTKKSTENRINAFEMWCYRRMEKVSWKEKKSNESILREKGIKSTLMESTYT